MQHFANYELVRRIAVGGMGEVYLARQRTAFGREVALKIIRPDLMYNTLARKRFQREAEVSSMLQHDHILPMLEFNEEQGRLFIVTPYIKGGTLAQRLESGALTLTDVRQVFSSLLDAVSYLHRRGVIHRDLKPGNILLEKTEDTGRVTVRLIDFGIAVFQGQIDEPLTAPLGEQMGTEAFMAPERLQGIVGPGNDIYSLGIILYLMLTGRFPDPDPTLRQPLPQILEKVVERCIAPDPADRFASVDDLFRAFDHACRSLSGQLYQPGAIPQPGPSSTTLKRSDVLKPEVSEEHDPQSHIPTVRDAPPFTRPGAQSVKSTSTPERRPVRPSTQEYAVIKPKAHSSPDLPAVKPRVSSPLQPALHQGGSLADQPTRPRGSSPSHPPLKPRGNTQEQVALNAQHVQGQNTLKARGTVQTPAPEVRLPPLPGKTRLTGEEFDAPTTSLSVNKVKHARLSGDAPTGSVGPSRPPRKRKKRGISPLLLVTLLILIVLVAISGIGYLAIQASFAATVAITPRAQAVKQVFTIKARPGVKSIDVGNAVIPANVFTSTQKGTQSGIATGRSGCVLGIFECKQTVSFVDISTIAGQLRPRLRTQVEQDLRKQAASANATLVGNIFYSDGEISSNPVVGTQSKTVTVTLTEQGSIEYIKSKEATELASQLLKRQLPKNYALLNDSVKIGQPVVNDVSVNGEVTMKIPVAAVSLYQFSTQELTTMQNKLKGMKVSEARAWLEKQPNVDPNAISIRLTNDVFSGDKLPANGNQITLTTLNPATLPQVALPTVPK